MRIRSLLQIPADIFEGLISQIPGGTGIAMRRFYWRLRLRKMGRSVRIETGVKIANPKCVSLGDNVCIDHCATILAGISSVHRMSDTREIGALDQPDPGTIEIGNNTHVAQYVLISGRGGGVRIGSDTTIASGSKVYSSVNHYRSKAQPSNQAIAFTHLVPSQRQYMIEGPVVIENNCGLAVNSVVLPGVHIDRDSFVTMSGVVRSGNYPVNSILEGNPARRIGDRYHHSKSDK